ncbi:carbamate kinase [Candidatus Neptunochlamydia vexilliferae]|uniref:Carbamate kinase n=1 Tax=Candidatus Neptunichlamydia vexilliferae TaxID=1651774 RepID=A0ABS0AXA4_9BACT|nr:carbamate kinase [Candidatus Neptunochlamydia vexilliferae]MBF5058772.1 Carbamate kinase [Candidatus Neptunochlamydia vexilliferae]
MMKKETILVALGGNALQRRGEKGSIEELLAHAKKTSESLAELVEAGYRLIITHGNGPQVGTLLLKDEYTKEKLPPMSLDVCVGETQGMIGYVLQQQLHNQLKKRKRTEEIITLCTQVVVDREDPAFKEPTKPVGLFYSREQAEVLKEKKGWNFTEERGKGFRRVVPSPLPIDIIEVNAIKDLIEKNRIVIACGGGGIPVIRGEEGSLEGVAAVIDKDRTAALLAKKVHAEIFMILTDVEHVALHFGAPNQKNLSQMTVAEAEVYLEKGEFGRGSMAPKVEAACAFIKSGGKKVLISSLEQAKEALFGHSGTVIK